MISEESIEIGKAILESLIEDGIVRLLDDTFVGIATDGIEVNLGWNGDMNGLYDYLIDHPEPTFW